jgi:signal transduction histidine kinase
MLTVIRKHAVRLHALLDKGIRLSAMKSEAWKFDFTNADLCAIVQEATADAIGDGEAQSIVIEQSLPESAWAVLDVVQMRSAIDAMLENAVQFSPPRGVVRVKIEQDTHSVRLMVTDHGPGIRPEFMPRVFEEFSVADPLHHAEGQGLSLALANQIILAHGGTIAVDSSKPGETTFSLTLPTAGVALSEMAITVTKTAYA